MTDATMMVRMARSCVGAIAVLCGCYGGLSVPEPGAGLGPGAGTAADGGDEGGGDDDDGGGTDPEAQCDGMPLQLGASAMLRLSQDQYANALRDLLGLGPLAQQLADDLPADEKLGAFTFNTAGVPSILADIVLRNAETAADDFVLRLAAELPCSAEGDAACAESLIDDLAPLALRRPLEADERERYVALFDEGAADSFDEGIRRVVIALLSSPSFLYRVELGDAEAQPGERLRLTSHEVATRLSLFLWNTIPDRGLLDAANAGELETAQGRRAQAERLIADPRARVTIGSFHAQWMGVESVTVAERDPELYPDFDADLAADMVDETTAFVNHVIFEADGSFESLMTASYTVATDDVLRLYGIDPAPDRDPALPVDLDPAQRGGVLTHASYLSATAHRDQASPILRGVSVREDFLCQGLPPPPPTADDVPPQIDPDGTTRDRFEQHTADPACAGCHVLIDPVGFGFSNYDAVGRFHDTENGTMIDASGELVSAGDASGTFDGAVELGERLATSTDARRCYGEQWFVFANGRRMEPDDECELGLAYDAFAESGFDIQELALAVVASPSFSHRVIADAPSE